LISSNVMNDLIETCYYW